jgi:antitoxin HigA-1
MDLTTPGNVIRELVLVACDITQDQLATAMRVSRYSINQLVNDRRAVTADMALRLAKATSTSPEFWLALQRNVDLERARRRLSRRKELEYVQVIRRPVSADKLYSRWTE